MKDKLTDKQLMKRVNDFLDSYDKSNKKFYQLLTNIEEDGFWSDKNRKLWT